ncbi:MAG: hypothetical protein SNI70_06080 [Rikenellaceae bacterium]
MSKVNFIAESKHYIYTLRRCETCDNFKECKISIGWAESMQWLNCGRCGCRNYAGDHIDESPKKRSEDDRD